MNKVLGNKKAISLFVVPALIVYTIIVMVPVIWSLYYSFFSGSPGLQWEFAGFDNYARLFRDKNFLNALTVNCKYVLVVTVGQVGMGLLLSLMFKFWLKMQNHRKNTGFLPGSTFYCCSRSAVCKNI